MITSASANAHELFVARKSGSPRYTSIRSEAFLRGYLGALRDGHPITFFMYWRPLDRPWAEVTRAGSVFELTLGVEGERPLDVVARMDGASVAVVVFSWMTLGTLDPELVVSK
jgi:hypothetical protein